MLDSFVAENDQLKVEISKLKQLLEKDEQCIIISELEEEIANLKDDKDLLKEEVQSLKTQNCLYSEIVTFEKSNSTRKNRDKALKKSLKTDTRAIRNVMIKLVFPFIKFIKKEDLQKMGGAANTIMKSYKLQIDETKQISWWATHYLTVANLFTEHRTEAAQKMKAAFRKGE